MNTAQYINYGGFALVCLALMMLPFLPAYQEWRNPTDAAALPISANYSNDIDHFARRLEADVAARLGEGPSTGYEEFDFVDPSAQNMQWTTATRRLIARSSIESMNPVRSLQPLFVQGNIHAAAKSSFSALYATGDISLGAESEVHDWAHADGTVQLARKSLALRRVSAGKAVELGEEAWFERLQAPTLHFGARPAGAAAPQAVEEPVGQQAASFADLPHAVRQTPSLYLVRGNCELLADRVYAGSLIVTGFLTVGQGTTVTGDVKARDGMRIGQGASVRGALTCEKRVHLCQEAKVAGPLISEGDILIGANSRVGSPDAQTSVSGRNIIVERGAVVHGAVWAHEIGMVKSA